MKLFKELLAAFAIVLLISGCHKTGICGSCEAATLYYTPDCATINGYVTLDKKNVTYVFQHNVDAKFRKTGVKVCISYHKEDGSKI